MAFVPGGYQAFGFKEHPLWFYLLCRVKWIARRLRRPNRGMPMELGIFGPASHKSRFVRSSHNKNGPVLHSNLAANQIHIDTWRFYCGKPRTNLDTCFVSSSARQSRYSRRWVNPLGPSDYLFGQRNCWIFFYIGMRRNYIPSSSIWEGCGTRSNFKHRLTGLNSEFSFS